MPKVDLEKPIVKTVRPKKGSDKFHRIRKEFVDYFYICKGNISTCIKKFDISRDTYYQWRKDHKDFAKDCDYARAELLDYARHRLVKLISEDDIRAITTCLDNEEKYAHFDEPDFKSVDEVRRHKLHLYNLVASGRITLDQADRLYKLCDNLIVQFIDGANEFRMAQIEEKIKLLENR